MNTATRLICFLVLTLSASAASAQSSLLAQGRYSLGFSGGLASRSVSVGAGFGYFVFERLQPAVSLGYTYVGTDEADSHQLRTTVELRYYVLESGWLAPYLAVEGGHVFLEGKGFGSDRNYHLGYVGGTLGALVLVGSTVGLQMGLGLGTYPDVPPDLVERRVVEDGLVITGRFGLTLFL
jgi:hypothetical protein